VNVVVEGAVARVVETGLEITVLLDVIMLSENWGDDESDKIADVGPQLNFVDEVLWP